MGYRRRTLCDRRETLTRRRVQTVSRLQAILAELLPGKAKRDITAPAGYPVRRPEQVRTTGCRAPGTGG